MDPLKDYLQVKEEETMIKEVEEKEDTAQILNDIYERRNQRKDRIKEELEKFRKAAGKSGFDFEKAIEYRDLIEMEKKRLKNITEAVFEMEKRSKN